MDINKLMVIISITIIIILRILGIIPKNLLLQSLLELLEIGVAILGFVYSILILKKEEYKFGPRLGTLFLLIFSIILLIDLLDFVIFIIG